MDTDYAVNLPKNADTIQATNLPDHIDQVDDDIVNKIIICEVSGKPFRIIKQELDWLRRMRLPLPRRHPNIRNDKRISHIDPWDFVLRKCDKTGDTIVSVHPTTDSKKVYSVKAYHEAIYG
jgi:hypothetical protein